MQQEQFKQQVLPLRKKLLQYAQRMLGDVEDAEDVIQEVYLKLWHMRDKLQSYDSIIALSSRITKNLCINKLKIRDRSQESLEGLIVKDEEPEPDVRLEQKDNVEHVMKLIDCLPKLQQTILRMRHVDGFEIEEIADLTGSNAEAIRVNLSRARKKVRDQFLKL
jgi:RNA polymerase sigma factor, sigma-70 family